MRCCSGVERRALWCPRRCLEIWRGGIHLSRWESQKGPQRQTPLPSPRSPTPAPATHMAPWELAAQREKQSKGRMRWPHPLVPAILPTQAFPRNPQGLQGTRPSGQPLHPHTHEMPRPRVGSGRALQPGFVSQDLPRGAHAAHGQGMGARGPQWAQQCWPRTCPAASASPACGGSTVRSRLSET